MKKGMLWFVVITLFNGINNRCRAESVSLEEYDRLITPTVPTLLSFESPYKNQHLFYAGICHDNSPDHYQYKTVDEEWDIFRKKTNLKNTVIIGELLPDAICSSYETKDEAIRVQSDCGYVLWLAQQHNLTLIGAELPYKTVIQQLLQEFKKEHVHYFCFAFAADFWTRYEEKPDLENFILERVHTWTDDPSITFDYLIALHRAYTGKTLSVPERSFFVRLMTLTHHTNLISRLFSYFSIPKKTLRIIYPILRRCHQLRDNHTFNVIRAQWDAGNNIFIIYGALHAAALKESLRKLTQQS